VFSLGHNEERPELLGIVGLEMFEANQTQAAQDLAKQAAVLYEAKPPPGAKETAPVKRPNQAPTLLALMLLTGQEIKAQEIFGPPPKAGEDVPEEIRVGYAQAWAFQGKLPEARDLTRNGKALPRCAALLGIAAVNVEKNPAEAHQDVEAALNLAGNLGGADTSWLLVQLVRIALRAGMADQAKEIPDRIQDASLQQRAQVEVARAQLSKVNQTDMQRMNEAASQKQPNPLLLELLARHNAHFGNGSTVMKTIAAWQPESVRPFGYLGVALGVQDSQR
jgi:hypothetical protein